MADYFLSNNATKDLKEIWQYTFETWSEIQANIYYDNLLDDCEKLSYNQGLGTNYSNVEDTVLGYKSGEHILFYIILSDSEIEIIRILHSKMDLKNRLNY